jgi:hypothetical protein
MLWISNSLDNLLKDGGKIISSTQGPHFTAKKHLFSASGTKPRRRWVENNRVDLGEVGWGDVD